MDDVLAVAVTTQRALDPVQGCGGRDSRTGTAVTASGWLDADWAR
jgi:hypothetical protein